MREHDYLTQFNALSDEHVIAVADTVLDDWSDTLPETSSRASVARALLVVHARALHVAEEKRGSR